MDEVDLIQAYVKHDDREAISEVMEGRMEWIKGLVNRQNLPRWVDRESVFADVLLDVFQSLRTYDPGKSKVDTFLWRVVACASRRSIHRQTDTRATEYLNDHAIEKDSSIQDALDSLMQVVNSIPADQINEESRKILVLLADGHDDTDISSMLGLTTLETAEKMSYLRNYLAWLLVDAGVSVEPVIMDTKLIEMAERYERDTRF